MTQDDLSLLTAYLDGELEPDQRLSIASALLADPELAEQLRRLAAVRGLVAGLPRPALTVDLVAAINARLGYRPVLKDLGQPSPARLSRAQAMGGFGLAATILVAVSIGLYASRLKRLPGPGSQLPKVVFAHKDRPAESRQTTETAATSPRDASAAAGPVSVSGSGSAGQSRQREHVAEDQSREAEKIRQMLDSPHLTRTFIVLDVQGGATRDRVEELVQKTPRTEAAYGRITVSQGIVIDPRHPNEATVFALVLNEQELRHFQKKLEQSFPERVEDAAPDPGVVTQLADIGQVAVLPGSPATEVVIPSELSPRVALRTETIPHETQRGQERISSEFGAADVAEIGTLGAPGVRGLLEKAGNSENLPGTQSPAGTNPPILARRDESPAVPSPDVGAGASKRPDAAGPLADSILKAPNLHELPSIVLVWVTSP